jgi:hypothetical protein
MNTLKIALFSTMLLFVFNSFGQATNSKIIEPFFKEYKIDPIKAYENLFVGNKWMKDKKSELETIKIKLNDLVSTLGEYYGYEIITEKKAGESLILQSFLVKYERQPLRFTFLLYKPNDSWQIQNFSYDANIDDELEEAAKAYRLKYNW